jgi:hypothetical protein
MTRHLALAFACALFVAARANAQGMISGAKAVAGRAAGAANAHTAAEQNPNGPQAPATAATSTTAASSAPAAKTTPVAAAPAAPAAAKTTPLVTMTTKTTPIPAASAKTTPLAAGTAKPATAATVAAKPGAPAKATTAKITPAVAPTVTSDTGARSISVTQRGIKGEVSLNREVFSYDAGGRRDPFVSLLRNGDLRPDVGDLCLMVVLYDPTGRNSVGIMRDVSTKDQYRVRVGVTLGRMRVAQIEPRQVVFTIEEIGYSRQEAVELGCSSTARTQ